MSANSIDNYDSPFYRMKESNLDRQIHALKTRFAEHLQTKIDTIPGIRDTTIVYPQLSTAIIITFKYATYKVRISYEMDKKQFQEPYTTFDSIDIAINGGKIAGYYDVDRKGQELRWRVVRIMEYCYDISKMPGFGTRRGEDWTSETASLQLAETEFQRLIAGSYESAQKEKEKQEAKDKKDKEFIELILRK